MATALGWTATAQHSLPLSARHRDARLGISATADNRQGMRALFAGLTERISLSPLTSLPMPAGGFVSTEQRPYLHTLATLSAQHGVSITLLRGLQERYPGLETERAALLVALYRFDQTAGQSPERALSTPEVIQAFSAVDPRGLVRHEADQYYALMGYLRLWEGARHSRYDEARTLLVRGSQGTSVWADRAALYHSTLLWAEDNPQDAMTTLTDRRWSPEVRPEVEYQGAMLGFVLTSPEQAIAHAQRTLKAYPELAQRARLSGAMGQAYYLVGDHQSAERMLSPLLAQGDLLPEEAYALGASLYHSGRYTEARPALMIASRAEGAVSAMAQLALGNIYRAEGEYAPARLALSVAMAHPDLPMAYRELAHYQLIELGFSSGIDAFGQNIRLTEDFLTTYPKSKHRARIIDLVGSYVASSADYAGSLSLLDRLERGGTDVKAIRQEVLLRQAVSLGSDHPDYMATLGRAVALGAVSTSYPQALAMRARAYLAEGRPTEAETDARALLKTDRDYHRGIGQYLLGYALYNQGKYADALPALVAYAGSGGEVGLKADALIRVGDVRLAQAQLSEALKAYQEADNLNPTGSDDALARMAGIYGQRAEYAQQIAIIDKAEREHPQSPHIPQLLYDKARALLHGMGRPADADNLFAQIERSYPASDIAPRAALERASMQSNMGNDDRAIEQYKRIVQAYPMSTAAQTALADMRSLYAERNELDLYAGYVAGLSRELRPQGEDPAHLAYIALESRTKRGEAVEAELEAFVREHPKASDRVKAQELLLTSYERSGQHAKALALVAQMLSEHPSATREIALRSREATLLAGAERYADASKSLSRAYELSSGTSAERLSIGLRYTDMLMRSGDYATTRAVASQLLERKDLTTDQRGELTLLRGRAEEAERAFKTAIQTYGQLTTAPHTAYGAEATVLKGGLLLRMGQAKQARELLETFTGSGSAQHYWMARAFVTLADCYEAEGDTYMAQQYIESLRDNYKGDEADIQEMIQTRLSKYTR